MNTEIASIRQREKFKSLLRERGISLRRMSIDLGLNESYFQQFVTYGRPSYIEGNVLELAAQYLDISADVLAPAGLNEPERTTPYETSGYKHNDGTIAVIPCYDLSVKLAADDWRNEQYQTHHMTFSRQMLRSITPVLPDNLAMLVVANDAMSPLLQQGDNVLLDCTCTTATQDGIYAILHDSYMLIKRLTIDPVRKLVTLSPDNPAYPNTREYSIIDLPLAGRVIWAGKKL
ncbi:MAG: S24 family peptidase [Alphaproteobacteria bacterium]|nr:S24 family peptidase [Alphaproteobacteria bacterium]